MLNVDRKKWRDAVILGDYVKRMQILKKNVNNFSYGVKILNRSPGSQVLQESHRQKWYRR